MPVKKIIFDQRAWASLRGLQSQKPELRPCAPLMLLALPKINRSCRLRDVWYCEKERVGFKFWRKWLPRRERRANSSWAHILPVVWKKRVDGVRQRRVIGATLTSLHPPLLSQRNHLKSNAASATRTLEVVLAQFAFYFKHRRQWRRNDIKAVSVLHQLCAGLKRHLFDWR